MRHVTSRALTMLLLISSSPTALYAAEAPDIFKMSLDKLTDMQVTSVSKKSEKASEAAAAIYVITSEDIHRSGATSIPEVLRMVPGLEVAQSGSHQWAISSRGFNDQFANKLLVLIDGRTVYTPLFSGVYWDVQDTLLEDIDRIEVIRGPGATLWGANAVNGVINIITKNSKDTQGNFVKALAGNYEKGSLSARHGGKLPNGAFYRVYGKYFDRDEARTATDSGANDSWHKAQAGFRMDWDKTSSDSYVLQGDGYGGLNHFTLRLPSFTLPFTTTMQDSEDMQGANILGRWTHKVNATSSTTLQSYVDYVARNNFVLDESRVTFDIDFQHNFVANSWNEITWGTGYRLVSDNLNGTEFLNFNPSSRNDNLFSAFIQDKITLTDSLFLTLGSKFEHNAYTGFEFQPSARVSWLITNHQTLWASVARAVRTPNRAADDISLAVTAIPTIPPRLIRLMGDESMESEELIAYEIGYRIQPKDNLSVDIATFYNDYDKLASNRLGTPFLETGTIFPPHIVIPFLPGNANSGQTYGIEVAMNWEPTTYWKLGGAYSLLKEDLNIVDTSSVTSSGSSPQQQFNLHSYLNLPHHLQFDNFLYYVDELQGRNIDGYIRFDTRLAWEPTPGVEVALVGQNLLDNAHPEFSPFLYNIASQVPRSVYASLTFRF